MEPLCDVPNAVRTLSVPGVLKLEIALNYPLSLSEEVLLTGKDACILKVGAQCVPV